MKIGLISDIHDNIANLKKAIALFNQKRVELVFFCGDLTSCFTIDYFRYLKAPVKAVFGNNEGDRIGIKRRIEDNRVNFQYAPKQGLLWDLELKNKRIGVYHGNQPGMNESLIGSQFYDFLFTGHNHIHQIKKVKKTLWVNPGTLTGWAGLDIKPIKATLALVDLETKKAEIIEI